MATPEPMSLFATTAKGMEDMLANELTGLGGQSIKQAMGGVHFEGNQEIALRACLWSRLANRILLPLRQFTASNPEQLYAGCAKIDWPELFDPQRTFAIDATLSRSAITHSRYAEQTVKDVIVDQFRDRLGVRPNVERQHPDIRINLYLHRDRAIVSLDLSGDSLHRRGYRVEAVEAPLKENLAAAILIRGGWPSIAAEGGALHDPMCGSGTLLIEGAWMAADIAPGILRTYFGFTAWRGFHPDIWNRLIREAEYRRDKGLAKLPAIAGSDISIKAVGIARANVEAAGLSKHIRVLGQPLTQATPPEGCPHGLLVTNPPYGERLGEVEQLKSVYHALGEVMQSQFQGWRATIFTGNPELAFQVPLRSHKSYALYNGALACKAFNFEINPERYFEPSADVPAATSTPQHPALRPAKGPWSEGAHMLANRLRKNQKKLVPWLKRQSVSCYRVYDADLPEYAVAIDLYQSESLWVNVQEYQAPKTIDADKALQRLRDVLAVVPDVFSVPPEQVSLKIRQRQKGRDQYQKLDTSGGFHIVNEGPARFWVNFRDYLDTGLFLDHRLTREMIGQLAADKRFLNLFSYTASATVHAVLGGANSSTSVDMSHTYIEWAQRNFELNGIQSEQHQLVQQNCLEWLQTAQQKLWLYDLIFIDPPTFSNSKRMDNVFDVQRDHVELIQSAMKLLIPDGDLIFSNNARRFKLDETSLSDLFIENISAQTLPQDFARNPKIHQCWRIRHAPRQSTD